MTTKQRTCAERINEHLESRLSSFRAFTEVFEARSVDQISTESAVKVLNLSEPERDDDTVEGKTLEQLQETARDRQNELPLSVELLRVVKVLLSTGGPADWFEATVGSDNEIVRIDYVFQDWFDGARETLHGDDHDDAAAFLREYVDIAIGNY